ncbi:isoprenoid biosynthesis glyoxalase ElbB [Wohlfahrtiimonas larvae]|uniref:Isoprenoid biosynthesis glyoxalase ElbB n=1 Tax=Wohlfahrtiimonas larvae TaxID=1157986 RepID=A0ABP9MR24_9GAMM|nr:isoprenoid biosynthesis glyoxalase ElbB [Wohlfahrtiimonas larvae]
MSKKVAFFLSGSGYLDGSEITEATSLIIALSKHNISVDFFAPNRPQTNAVNHLNGQAVDETRNILVESARIARGKISAMNEFNATAYDAVILPGGFGAVKNFTTFLEDGINGSLQADIKKALSDTITHNKWIVGICAAPLVIALAMRDAEKNAMLTFGQSDSATDFLPALNAWKIKHIETKINEHCIDKENKIITSGAYMFHDAKPYDIYICSDFVIETLLKQLSNH